MALPPLVVNPSRKEAWAANFEEVKEFFVKNGHLTIPGARLSHWLTYQRRHAKTLKPDQIERLESIHYKDISFYRVNPSKGSSWSRSFDKVEEFYNKNGHLSIPCSTLSRWLHYQRRNAKKLSKDKHEQLEGIGFNEPDVFLPRDAISWEEKFTHLKKFQEKDGNIQNIQLAGGPLLKWLTRQQRKFSNGQLDPVRRTKFEEIGVNLNQLNLCKARAKSSKMEIKESNEERHDAQWMAQYEKLKTYHRQHENCNVPRCYILDPALGVWVSGQRSRYKKKHKKGSAPMAPERVAKLELLGFT
jgi:hypothetical protein